MSSVLVVRSLGCKTGSIVRRGRGRGARELTSMKLGLNEGEVLGLESGVGRGSEGAGGMRMSLKAKGAAREKRGER
jgi:hypothetical protein